ncbi:MAG: DMT family transporter [Rhodospirillales bacterium]|nr:DMT family transporter [Rhodospirillales bacterium]
MTNGPSQRMMFSPSVMAAGLVTLAAACTATNSVIVRTLTDMAVDPLEIAFFRNVFGLMFMLPWLVRNGVSGLRTDRPLTHIGRAVVNLAGMVLFFQAIALIPVANVVAINFTGPILTSVLAVFLLGEAMRARRWGAVILGFLGALIIIRPGFAEVGAGVLSAVAAAVSWAVMQIMAKSLSHRESPQKIVTLNLLLMVPVSFIPVVFVWTTPSLFALALMALHGVLGTVNQVFIVRAFSLTDTTYVMPFDFTRLPFVALLAFFLFGEIPPFWTWIGGAVIFASTLYLTHRESRDQ